MATDICAFCCQSLNHHITEKPHPKPWRKFSCSEEERNFSTLCANIVTRAPHLFTSPGVHFSLFWTLGISLCSKGHLTLLCAGLQEDSSLFSAFDFIEEWSHFLVCMFWGFVFLWGYTLWFFYGYFLFMKFLFCFYDLFVLWNLFCALFFVVFFDCFLFGFVSCRVSCIWISCILYILFSALLIGIFFNVCYLEHSVVFLIFYCLHCTVLCGLSFGLFHYLHVYFHVFVFIYMCCFFCLSIFQVRNAAPSAASDLQLFSEDAKLKPTWWYKEESMCEEKNSVQHCSNWALPDLQYLDIMSEWNYPFYWTTDFWEIK